VRVAREAYVQVGRVGVEPGVELAVEVRGEGPDLLCVHGFGGAKEDFGDHVEALAGRWRVITVDLRGHGDSDGPADPATYSLDRMARDVEAVADAVGADRFRLLGHSMGGMVARRVVLARPDRVAALVMMSTAAGPPAGLDPDLVDLGAALALDDWPALAKLLEEVAPLRTPAYQRVIDEREGFGEFIAWKWSRVAPPMWAALAPQIVREPVELDRLREVTCPTLVIVGDLDAAFYDGSLAIADAVPGSRLAVIGDAGHHPQFEQPEAWLDAVTSFLDDVDRREGVKDD
jgi:pimeloyl-ACP methyl ester carboxylesterase